jgi:hypothetical protein
VTSIGAVPTESDASTAEPQAADGPAGRGRDRRLRSYSPEEHRPLGAYAALAGLFEAGFLAFCASQARREETLPERLPARDIALMAVATQKVSRQVAKDKVTSFLRAPFVRYEGSAGPSEVDEVPRGRGLRYALGELLTCPFCLSQWFSAGMVAAYARRPRATRSVAAVFAVASAADFVQLVYAAAQERT